MVPFNLSFSNPETSSAKGGVMGNMGGMSEGAWIIQSADNGGTNGATATPPSHETTISMLYIAAALAGLWLVIHHTH